MPEEFDFPDIYERVAQYQGRRDDFEVLDEGAMQSSEDNLHLAQGARQVPARFYD